MSPVQNQTHHHKKRHGHHQKRSRHFLHTYYPYIPVTVILFLSLFLSGYHPHPGNTLAYATSISNAGLLKATNIQRKAQGKPSLELNEKLNAAAQAKAIDMTSRDYWSHNTPEGKEPWIFIVNADYDYLKAGENLAYGFTTSYETINGWMNSKTHRANMLDADYSEVGFGFANSSNFNNAGRETVVVAMYGKPSMTATASKSKTLAQETQTEADTSLLNSDSSESLDTLASSKPVTRIEALSGSAYVWMLWTTVAAMSLLLLFLLIRHSLLFRRIVKHGERFVIRHPVIDATVVALLILGLTLTRTVGFTL